MDCEMIKLSKRNRFKLNSIELYIINITKFYKPTNLEQTPLFEKIYMYI